MDSKFKKIILKNGIKVIIIPLDTKLTHISTSILTGFFNENDKTRHITHYFEHLFARFTSKKFKDDKYILNELANKGAYSNAFVDDYETCFYINGKYEDLEFFMNILSNSIKDFYYNENLASKEKKAVLQEINNIISGSKYEYNISIFKYLFPKHRNIVDYKKHIKNVKRFTNRDIKNFIRNNLCTKNMVVTITCPKIKIREVQRNVYNFFGKIRTKNKCNDIFPILKHNNRIFKIIGIKNNLNNNNLIRLYLCKNIEFYSREHFMLLVLKDILFNFNIGIFYKILRDKLGLIYNMSFKLNIDYIDKRSSYIYLSTTSNFKNLPIIIKELINIISTYKITENDIKIARNINYIDFEKIKFNDISSYNYTYKKHLLYKKKFVSNYEMFKTMNNFTFKEITEYFELLRKEILEKGIIFYYSKKELNETIDNNLKKTIIKNNYKLSYI